MGGLHNQWLVEIDYAGTNQITGASMQCPATTLQHLPIEPQLDMGLKALPAHAVLTGSDAQRNGQLMLGIAHMVARRSRLPTGDRLRVSEAVDIGTIITDQRDGTGISYFQIPAGLVAHCPKIDAVEFCAFPYRLPSVDQTITCDLSIDAQLRPLPSAFQRYAAIAVDDPSSALLRHQSQRLPG